MSRPVEAPAQTPGEIPAAPVAPAAPAPPPPAEPGLTPAPVTSPPLADEPWAGLPEPALELSEPLEPMVRAPEPAAEAPQPVVEPAEPTGGTVPAGPPVVSKRRREGHRRLPRAARPARGTADSTTVRGGRRAARRQRGRQLPVLGGLVAAAAVAVLVLGTVDLVRYSRTTGAPAVNAAASRQAVTAAVNAAKPLLGYDYRTPVKTKVAATAPLLTPSCTAAYTKDLNVLASTLDPLKVVETAQVNSSPGNAGVQTTAKGKVTVLIFAVQTATNSRLTAPSVTPVQVSFTMVRPADTWLVDGVVAKGSGGTNSSVC